MSAKLLKDALKKRSAVSGEPTSLRPGGSTNRSKRRRKTASGHEKATNQRSMRKAVKREAATQTKQKHTDHTRANIKFLGKAAATEKATSVLERLSKRGRR